MITLKQRRDGVYAVESILESEEMQSAIGKLESIAFGKSFPTGKLLTVLVGAFVMPIAGALAYQDGNKIILGIMFIGFLSLLHVTYQIWEWHKSN